MSERDVIDVASNPAAEVGRILTTTPWAIAVQVAHREITYGTVIEKAHYGYVLKCIKMAVFHAVRDAIVENSRGRAP